MKITGDMLIGDVLRNYPEVSGTLLACGMHCLGCPSSQAESLEEACMVHGLNTEAVLAALNENVAK